MQDHELTEDDAIGQLFTEGEISLLLEGLCLLRETKVAAAVLAKEQGLAFTERDFGIPDIDRLLLGIGGHDGEPAPPAGDFTLG